MARLFSWRERNRSRGLRITLAVSLGFVIAATYLTFRQSHSRSAPTAATNTSATDPRKGLDAEQANMSQGLAGKPDGLKDSIRLYRNLSRDIDQILSGNWESRGIGGVLAVAITNWQFNRDQLPLISPEGLGFERIVGKDALVNRVLNNEVRLNEIMVTPVASGTFRIRIVATNLTNRPLACYIPKGQIVEVRAGDEKGRTAGQFSENYPQNITKSPDGRHDGYYVIPPRDEGTFEFPGFCINEGLKVPRGSANLTIYQLRDRGFKSLAELRNQMRKLRRA